MITSLFLLFPLAILRLFWLQAAPALALVRFHLHAVL